MTVYIHRDMADIVACLAYHFLHRKKHIFALVEKYDNPTWKRLTETCILLRVVLQ